MYFKKSKVGETWKHRWGRGHILFIPGGTHNVWTHVLLYYKLLVFNLQSLENRLIQKMPLLVLFQFLTLSESKRNLQGISVSNHNFCYKQFVNLILNNFIEYKLKNIYDILLISWSKKDNSVTCWSVASKKWVCLAWFVVFNAAFNNIAVISWWSFLLVEKTGVPGENHWPAANHWQTISTTVHESYKLEWPLLKKIRVA